VSSQKQLATWVRNINPAAFLVPLTKIPVVRPCRRHHNRRYDYLDVELGKNKVRMFPNITSCDDLQSVDGSTQNNIDNGALPR
jgi:hypothetical protein